MTVFEARHVAMMLSRTLVVTVVLQLTVNATNLLSLLNQALVIEPLTCRQAKAVAGLLEGIACQAAAQMKRK